MIYIAVSPLSPAYLDARTVPTGTVPSCRYQRRASIPTLQPPSPQSDRYSDRIVSCRDRQKKRESWGVPRGGGSVYGWVVPSTYIGPVVLSPDMRGFCVGGGDY